MVVGQRRCYSSIEVVKEAETPAEVESVEARNHRLGIDTKFDAQKHGYVLTFPWNFPEIIEKFEAQAGRNQSQFWDTFMKNSGAEVDFNNLFREFHQFCALPEQKGINRICEPRLAEAVNKSVERIHFHGLDVEMANLTVH